MQLLGASKLRHYTGASPAYFGFLSLCLCDSAVNGAAAATHAVPLALAADMFPSVPVLGFTMMKLLVLQHLMALWILK